MLLTRRDKRGTDVESYLIYSPITRTIANPKADAVNEVAIELRIDPRGIEEGNKAIIVQLDIFEVVRLIQRLSTEILTANNLAVALKAKAGGK